VKADGGNTPLSRRAKAAYLFPGIVRPVAAGKNQKATSERGLGMDLRSFTHDEAGQGLVEYALIIAVIAVAVIVAMIFLRDQLTNIFSTVGNNLT